MNCSIFDDCPNWQRAREELEAVIAELGLEVRPQLVRVPDDQAAKRVRSLGSPTVRVNGRDVDPDAPTGDYMLACRVHWNNGHQEGLPPRAWLVAALRASSSQAT